MDFWCCIEKLEKILKNSNFHENARARRDIQKYGRDSTKTTNLDKISVQTPRTIGHSQAVRGQILSCCCDLIVYILLFTFQNVNNEITTTTQNLPTQPGYVLGICTDILSEFVVFVESCPYFCTSRRALENAKSTFISNQTRYMYRNVIFSFTFFQNCGFQTSFSYVVPNWSCPKYDWRT